MIDIDIRVQLEDHVTIEDAQKIRADLLEMFQDSKDDPENTDLKDIMIRVVTHRTGDDNGHIYVPKFLIERLREALAKDDDAIGGSQSLNAVNGAVAARELADWLARNGF